MLTDLVMPGMSGHELADELAQSHPEVKMLFMSGYTEDSATRRDILTARQRVPAEAVQRRRPLQRHATGFDPPRHQA